METTLKIMIKNMDRPNISGVLRLVGEIENDHPNLFQQIEVVMEC